MVKFNFRSWINPSSSIEHVTKRREVAVRLRIVPGTDFPSLKWVTPAGILFLGGARGFFTMCGNFINAFLLGCSWVATISWPRCRYSLAAIRDALRRTCFIRLVELLERIRLLARRRTSKEPSLSKSMWSRRKIRLSRMYTQFSLTMCVIIEEI